MKVSLLESADSQAPPNTDLHSILVQADLLNK